MSPGRPNPANPAGQKSFSQPSPTRNSPLARPISNFAIYKLSRTYVQYVLSLQNYHTTVQYNPFCNRTANCVILCLVSAYCSSGLVVKISFHFLVPQEIKRTQALREIEPRFPLAVLCVTGSCECATLPLATSRLSSLQVLSRSTS